MQREKGKLKFRRLSPDPSIVEVVIVVILAIIVVALATGLPFWLFLAAVGAFVANALGHNPWLGVAVVGVVWLLRLIFGK